MNDGNHNFSGLRRVFVEFSKHTFDKKSTGNVDTDGIWIPFYDQLYQVIDEEIKQYHGDESVKYNLSRSISNIPDPFGTEWPRPTVENWFFERLYAEQIRNARKTVLRTSTRLGSWFKKLWSGK